MFKRGDVVKVVRDSRQEANGFPAHYRPYLGRRGMVVEYDGHWRRDFPTKKNKWVRCVFEDEWEYAVPEKDLELFDHPRPTLYAEHNDNLVDVTNPRCWYNLDLLRQEAKNCKMGTAGFGVDRTYWLMVNVGTCVVWEKF